jgi:hypothetical protein
MLGVVTLLVYACVLSILVAGSVTLATGLFFIELILSFADHTTRVVNPPSEFVGEFAWDVIVWYGERIGEATRDLVWMDAIIPATYLVLLSYCALKTVLDARFSFDFRGAHL